MKTASITQMKLQAIQSVTAVNPNRMTIRFEITAIAFNFPGKRKWQANVAILIIPD